MQVLSKSIKAISVVALLFFTYLMVQITVQYIPMRMDAAFLFVKEEAIRHTYYQVAFFSHVYTSIFVLILGMFQFSTWIRSQYSSLHRNLGKIYVILILLIASPSGLIMGFHANGGLYPQISFVMQAILWFAFTWIAFRSALSRQWTKHQNFMMRSYALTLSAISLRLFKWIIVHTLELPPMDTYRIVAWLGWIVNLVIVEMYISLRKSQES